MRKPIGIFDFGIGGLTVMKEVVKALPHESVIFLNDNLNLAAGNDSETAVKNNTVAACEFLIQENVKAVVIACNTATVVALDHLRQKYSLPIIGVVEPTAKTAFNATKNGRIGVIGTNMTVRSNAYPKAMKALDQNLVVVSKACPLLVPMIEEGFVENEAIRIVAFEYLKEFQGENIDTLILGCTHYSLIMNMLSRALPNVTLIDSGPCTANDVKLRLLEANSINKGGEPASYTFYATELNDQFHRVACFAGGSFSAIQLDFKKADLS